MTAPGHDLLGRFGDDDRAVLTTGAESMTYPEGTELFRAGDPAIGCWLVRSGHVALRTDVPGRGQVIVQTLGAGDVVGLSWLVPPHRWQFTATASSDVAALRLDTDRLRTRAAQDSAFGYPLALAIFDILLSRLQNTRARLLDVYGSPGDR